jgi:integrase
LEGRDPDAFLFSPAEARQALYAERRVERRSPRWPSHARAQAAKKKAALVRPPRDHYDRFSYAHAVARAARKAGVPHWHPHQLKHSIATEVRKRHGAEAAQVYVGHAQLSTTEIYAEKDLAKVERIALELG